MSTFSRAGAATSAGASRRSARWPASRPAARIAIDLDTNEAHTFLASLARELGVDGELAA